MHPFPNSSFSGENSNYEGPFDLIPAVSFVPCLKIYDPGDQRAMRTLSNDSEGTRLICRSRSKVSIVSISNRSTGIIGRPFSGKRTANFNFNVGDHLLKFIWLLTASGIPTAARKVDDIGDDNAQYHESHSHPI